MRVTCLGGRGEEGGRARKGGRMRDVTHPESESDLSTWCACCSTRELLAWEDREEEGERVREGGEGREGREGQGGYSP